MFVVFVRLQLIDDKKSLSEKCEKLVQDLKSVDKKYQDKIRTLEDKLVQHCFLHATDALQ